MGNIDRKNNTQTHMSKTGNSVPSGQVSKKIKIKKIMNKYKHNKIKFNYAKNLHLWTTLALFLFGV